MKTKQQIQHQIFENKFKLLMYQLHIFNLRGSYTDMVYENNRTILEDSFGNTMYTDGFIEFKKTETNGHPVYIHIEHRLSHYNQIIKTRGKVLNRINHWEQKYYNLLAAH